MMQIRCKIIALLFFIGGNDALIKVLCTHTIFTDLLEIFLDESKQIEHFEKVQYSATCK